MNRSGILAFGITSRPAAVVRAAALAVGLSAVVLGGCAKKKPAPPATQPADDPMAPLTAGADLSRHAADAVRQAETLKALADQLDAVPLDHQRPVLKQVFATLVEALPNLNVARPTGVFSHQFGSVVYVRDQLGSRPDRLPDAALVDDGLRAAYNVLRDLAFSTYFENADLATALDKLSLKVNALSNSRGIEHSVTVAESVRMTSDVLVTMAGMLRDRTAAMAPVPSTGPATAPATVVPPATAPMPTDPATPPPATPTDPAVPPATPPVTPTDPAAPPATTPPATPTDPAAPPVPPATPTDPAAPALPPTTPPDPATPPPAPTDPAAPPAVTPPDPATPPPAPTDPAAPPAVTPADPGTPPAAPPADQNK